MQYAKELQQYIPVDIYGQCGTRNCSHSTENECFEMLNEDYKFYLAFENANCKDYITEKLLRNSLG
jgi:glycoprotein 3-alpha-L-fucosyltransferase